MRMCIKRVAQLPTYAVGQIAERKRQLIADGVDVIDLGVGDADIAPPEIAVSALHEAAQDRRMSRYAFQLGLMEFRESVQRFMERRFDVTVDPQDEEGVHTLQTIFQFDVTLPAHVRVARVGGRAYVRFDHGGEPLAQQWYRAIRQLFLSHFNV